MADPSAPSLRDRIAESVMSADGGVLTSRQVRAVADAVLAVLADADPTDLWGLVWRRLGNAHPRTKETTSA